MIDVPSIRRNFPQFGSSAYHYLDSSATSLTPQSVLDAEIDYYTHMRSNVHRGIFKEAIQATSRYEEVRKKIASFIGANDPRSIIFTSGGTASANMLARMVEESTILEGKENIVTSVMEHHSAFLPIAELGRRRNLQIRTTPLDGVGLSYASCEELITDETAIVSVTLASNVTGVINDIRRISDVAHSRGAFVVVDMTAAVGHIPIDVRELGVDACYFSGHKMFGPTGVGILYVTMPLLEHLPPVFFGGHMIDHFEGDRAVWATIPDRYEAGTPNIGGVIGLGAAVDFIHDIELRNIVEHNRTLVAYGVEALENVSGVRVVSERDASRNIGIVSFTCDFAHPHDVAEILARDGVAVRTGHHCAIPLHNALSLPSTVRASVHVYNTTADIDALVEGVSNVREIFCV